MTAEDLARAKALVEAATPGPWEVGERCGNAGPGESCSVVMSTSRTSPTGHTWQPAIFKDESYDECHHIVSSADAAFIAASRTLVPELIAEVERLRAVIARWEAFGAKHDIKLRKPGCTCDREEGDSPCPVHEGDE